MIARLQGYPQILGAELNLPHLFPVSAPDLQSTVLTGDTPTSHLARHLWLVVTNNNVMS